MIFSNLLKLHLYTEKIIIYKVYFKHVAQIRTSVNIRAVRPPVVLNCPGTNLRPSSCPTLRKTGALFWVWPHWKTWLTPLLATAGPVVSPRVVDTTWLWGDPALHHQPLLRAGDGRMAHASTAATLISWLILVHSSLIIVLVL